MTTTEARLDIVHWRQRLASLASRYRVPAAALGILRGEDLVETACGVLNKKTGVAATRGSLFQIGSITKVWTATLVMQLVDEGRLDLDSPVVDVLPEFAVADAVVTKQVTMRHLLCHTSGIDGDVLTDTGRGDDCLARYVELLGEVGQNHPIDATWSYCNSGFALAGRVVEKLTGTTWDSALRERILRPLGLAHTVTLPEEALLHCTAVGHLITEDQDCPGQLTRQPTGTWGIPRSMGPAGGISTTVRDLLRFAQLHLHDGVLPDGGRLLSASSASAMRRKEADLPDRSSFGDSWGLGWSRFNCNGHQLLGHDGSTIGQSAYLRLLPEADLAVALLTNGERATDLFRDLFLEIFDELAGLRLPDPLEPPGTPADIALDGYCGRYERAGMATDVFPGDDGLVLRSAAAGPLAESVPNPVQEYPMVPVREGLFLIRPKGIRSHTQVTFYTLDDGAPYVHYGARANPKVC